MSEFCQITLEMKSSHCTSGHVDVSFQSQIHQLVALWL